MSGIVGSRFNIRGSGLVGKLGTDGQVFTSAGAGKSAVFEDAAAGGKILQVQSSHNNNPSTISSNSTSWITSGITVTITPSASNSKILLMFSSGLGYSDNDGETHRQLYRNINSGGETALGAGGYGMANYALSNFTPWEMTWLDSPSTTSSTVYSVWHKTGNASNDSVICWSTSYYELLAIEVGA